MASVTLGGNPINLRGEMLEKGQSAPDFKYVKNDMSEAQLSELKGQSVVLIAVPSLDTPVCATETRQFNQKLAEMPHVQALVVSLDLPFAMNRFCETDGIKNVHPISDYRYKEFVEKYNLEMVDGPLKGLSARAVLVLDKDQNVQYSELVPEIGQEPNYEEALQVLKSLA